MPPSMASRSSCSVSTNRYGEVGRPGLGRQAADALAVHGQLGGARRGRDAHGAGGLQLDQQAGGDGLDFRDNDVRPFLVDDLAQGIRVRHGHHVGAVRHLLPRRVRVPVHGDDLHAQALQGDDDLLAQLSGAEQHHSGGEGRQGRAKDGTGNAGHEAVLGKE